MSGFPSALHRPFSVAGLDASHATSARARPWTLNVNEPEKQPMKPLSSLALLAALTVAPAGSLAAQDRGYDQAPPPPAEAADKKPVFVRAALGKDAALRDASGERVGTVQDHVVERKTGRVAVFAVEVAGADGAPKTVGVPFSALAFDAEARELRVSLGLTELQALPEFDAKKARDGAMRAEPREAAAAKDAAPKHLLSSEIHGGVLEVEGSAVGKVAGLVIEPSRGMVVFALAGREGGDGSSPVLVPWAAMKWSAPAEGAEEREKAHFALSVAPEKLEAAPRLERGDLKSIDKTLVTSVFAFWGVQPGVRGDR
ncbi:MAG: PRC-barrel domain-containing protein [Planctomycetota bacterium]